MNILIMLVLYLGIFFFLIDDIVALIKFIFSGRFIDIIYEAFTGEIRSRKVKIKTYIERELKAKKEPFLIRYYKEMKNNISYMGDDDYAKYYGIAFVICGIIGVAIAMVIGNVFMIPVLGCGLALVPTWIAKIREYRFRNRLNTELSVVLSAVTTSYIRSNNIIKAVEENVESMRNPVRKVFLDFLSRYKYIDKSIKNNLRILSGRYRNKIFKLWCQELLVCQDDISYKQNLSYVVTQFSIDKELQDSLSVKLNNPIKETVLIILITSLLYPLLAFFGNGALEALTSTVPGQILSTLLWMANIYAVDRAINISAPVE